MLGIDQNLSQLRNMIVLLFFLLKLKSRENHLLINMTNYN